MTRILNTFLKDINAIYRKFGNWDEKYFRSFEKYIGLVLY